MNTKFISLVLLTIAVVTIAWKISEDRAPLTEVARTTLYPGLIDQLNDIARVNVRSVNQESTLVRDGDVWKLENLDGYAAAFTNIKRTILQIADLEVIEAKTTLAESYERIGVEDLESDDASGKQIELLNEASEPIANLIVGNRGDAGNQSQYYVRKHGDEQSWLVSGALEISSDPLKWVDTAIADIDTERVRQVSITAVAGDPILISKDERKKNFFELANVPDGFKVKSKSTVSSIGAIMLNLDFSDVTAASVLAEPEPRRTLELQTFDGLIVNLQEFDYGDKVWVRFHFLYDPGIVVLEADEGDTETSEDNTDVAEKDKETVEEEAARLMERTALWAYELPSYKARTIDKSFEDLIEEVEPVDEPDEE